jgi:predicted PurR-regulated permease PerM
MHATDGAGDPPPKETESDARSLHTAIRIAALALLAYGVWFVLNPLLTILCWSAILTIALYPLHERITALVGSAPASAGLVGLLLLVIALGPLTLLAVSFVRGVATIGAILETGQLRIPNPPEVLEKIPLAGETVQRAWSLAVENIYQAIRENVVLLKSLAVWLIGWAQSAITGLAQFVISILLTSFLLPLAPQIVGRSKLGLSHILGQRTEEVLAVAVSSIRSVGRGVIGVSLLQALLAGLGFVVAGIPQPGLLAFAMLFLSIIQLGSILVLLPVTIWAWANLGTTPALIFTAYMIFVGLMDNVLRALYFSRDAHVPAPVIIAGAIGGALSFGLIGLFLGPVLLCVVWNLLTIWTVASPEDAFPDEPGSLPPPRNSAPRQSSQERSTGG